ncbi:MAG: hypothetical protein HT580_03330 [Dechloromonas sp.]|nr:MAG: hypothetical protein HT580_03330 [Dechloromonas sp.]
MQCQLLSFQQTIQSNGKTLFIALPIPDKLSAYHDDLVDPTLPRGIIDQLSDPRLNRPQVEKVIQAEIAAGNLDIYLPNDTHFGGRGQALTAETVLQYIEKEPAKSKQFKLAMVTLKQFVSFSCNKSCIGEFIKTLM